MTSEAFRVENRRQRVGVPAAWHDSLFRNGGLLTLSSVLSSVVGFGYWTIAARIYKPETVGRNSAAISAMTFIAGLAELNLMSALVRFVPVAGTSTGRLVRRVYAVSLTAAMFLAGGFLAIVDRIAPNLGFLTTNALMAVGFVAAAMVWTVFVLQDSILTALRRTWLVPVENVAFAVTKLVLVVALATVLDGTGIFLSWSVALLVSVLPVNGFIFRRAIPAHQRAGEGQKAALSGRSILRFAAADYGGAMAWLAATNLTPILVLDLAGAQANGYFAVAWVIAYALYLVSANMGISLVVETAGAHGAIAAQGRTVVAETMKVIVPVVAAIVVAAPLVLGAFGSGYSANGATTLRLLALSAIPNVFTATAVSVLRAQSRTGTGTVLLLLLAGLVFGLTVLLMPRMGIAGVGWAWLIAQSMVAGLVIAVAPHGQWSKPRPIASTAARSALSLLKRAQRLGLGLPTRPGRGGRAEPPERALAEAISRISRSNSDASGSGCGRVDAVLQYIATESDLLVARVRLVGGPEPAAVLKVARSPEAARELAADLSVVSALRSDPVLAGWVPLLPRRIASWASPTRGYSLEAPIPGVDGRLLDWTDHAVATTAVSAAGEAIAVLHGLTGRSRSLDERDVRRLVQVPVAALLPLYREHSHQVRALIHLESLLSSRLLGREMTLGWVHGDFTPGNLIMTPDGSSVRGIVDWGGGIPSAPACIDTATLLVGTRMLRSGRELGEVMLDVAHGAVLTDTEQGLLAGDPTELETQWKLALSWLNHVSANIHKASYYGKHLLWRVINVDPFLDEVSGW